MALTRIELAKYPFVLDAAEEVKKLDLDITNLENPILKTIVDRAQNRIEEALKTNPPQVSYTSREEDIEIPSFPVSIILAAASNNDYIKRRYALAEARRAYELLQEEDKEKIIEVAKKGNYDLIIMGSHGHGAAKRFLLGSVSDHVLHYADRSILLIK